MSPRRHTSHRRRRHTRRRIAPSTAIAGYTRRIQLDATAPNPDLKTGLVTVDVPGVVTPSEETVNRKLIRVSGEAFFSCSLSAQENVAAQFCLWAHPEHEGWPSVDDYDPFNDGPGESGFEGMLAPRAFCRRTFVLAVPTSGSAETISSQHRISSKAERLLRPGWKLSAGLYVSGSSGVSVSHISLLRYVVAG